MSCVATRMRRCGVGGEDRGIVLGIALRRWIDGAGPRDSVDIVEVDCEEEWLCEDVGRMEAAILMITRLG